MTHTIKTISGIQIPQEYQQSVDLAKAYAIGTLASKLEFSEITVRDELQPYKSLEIAAGFGKLDSEHNELYSAFKSGFGDRSLVLSDYGLALTESKSQLEQMAQKPYTEKDFLSETTPSDRFFIRKELEQGRIIEKSKFKAKPSNLYLGGILGERVKEDDNPSDWSPADECRWDTYTLMNASKKDLMRLPEYAWKEAFDRGGD